MFVQEPPPPPPASALEHLAAIPEAGVDRPATVFEDVLVLNRGDNIRVVGSGILWVVLPAKGQLPDGRVQFFYITVGAPGMPAPPVSGLCRFEARRVNWTGGMITGENDLPRPQDHPNQPMPAAEMWSLERFDCAISSDSPVIAPPENA